MPKAIRVHAPGGPEVMQWEDVPSAAPGRGEVLIRQTAIWLNFLDVYYRAGLYPAPNGLPIIPGGEGAGVVIGVGEGVTELSEGDRVAYAIGTGAYAEERLMPADKLVKIPAGVSDEQAAAIMLKGMTVEFLLRRTFKLGSGHTALFHAAAGGVGLIAGQWAKHLGATIIGTVSSAAKAELARAHGYDHVINYADRDFVADVLDITGGAKCDVVYDSVGKDTFERSLDCAKRLGLVVLFGQSSGPVQPLNPALLAQKGSLFLTRPTIFGYNATREELVASAAALFDVVSKGVVKVSINQRYALKDVARAHADLEGRKTTGATVILP